MSNSPYILEFCVLALALLSWVVDRFASLPQRRFVRYAVILALGGILAVSLSGQGVCSNFGPGLFGWFIQDPIALFFKRLLLAAGILFLLFNTRSASSASIEVSPSAAPPLLVVLSLCLAASARNHYLFYLLGEVVPMVALALSFKRGVAPKKFEGLPAGLVMPHLEMPFSLWSLVASNVMLGFRRTAGHQPLGFPVWWLMMMAVSIWLTVFLMLGHRTLRRLGCLLIGIQAVFLFYGYGEPSVLHKTAIIWGITGLMFALIPLFLPLGTNSESPALAENDESPPIYSRFVGTGGLIGLTFWFLLPLFALVFADGSFPKLSDLFRLNLVFESTALFPGPSGRIDLLVFICLWLGLAYKLYQFRGVRIQAKRTLALTPSTKLAMGLSLAGLFWLTFSVFYPAAPVAFSSLIQDVLAEISL